MIFSIFWLLWPVLYAAGALGVGTAATTYEAAIVHFISILAGCLLPFRGVWYIVLAKRNGTPFKPRMLVQTVFETALVPIILFLPRFSYRAFSVFLLIYFSFHAAVQGINAFIYLKNRVLQFFFPAFFQSIAFTLFFVGIIFLPEGIRYRSVMAGSGALLSMLGHIYLWDWLSVVLKNDRAAGFFRKISVTMPGFSGLGVPFRLIETLKSEKDATPHDAEIIFNFGKSGTSIAGHCELCIDGRTYTYGNYDPDSRFILKTMGNGILFRADKQKYIDFLTKEEHRTVIIYGLLFSRRQKKRFKKNIAHFESLLIPWEDEAANTPPDEYIHRIKTELDADIYRINEGRFKTYFLPTINCVTLTGNLLSGTTAGKVVIPGVYTPGAYMDALHRLYVAGDDVVVSVNTYNA